MGLKLRVRPGVYRFVCVLCGHEEEIHAASAREAKEDAFGLSLKKGRRGRWTFGSLMEKLLCPSCSDINISIQVTLFAGTRLRDVEVWDLAWEVVSRVRMMEKASEARED